MYGMIHRAARQMVTEQLGATVWGQIETAAGVSEDHFISGASYEDRITLSIIDATAVVTGTGAADVLRDFGQYWIRFAGDSAFASVMKMAGDDLPAERTQPVVSVLDPHRGHSPDARVVRVPVQHAVTPSRASRAQRQSRRRSHFKLKKRGGKRKKLVKRKKKKKKDEE